jgi:hypothetical protein
MSDKTVSQVTPTALTTTLTTNIYNGGGASALIKDIITHIHVANKTAAAHNFSLWLGATGGNAAGTELFIEENVPANDVFDWYTPGMVMTSTQFLVGGADANTALTISINGKQQVV